MDWTEISAQLKGQLGGVVVLATVMIMVITDKLVWHKRLEAAEKRADRWEKIALDQMDLARTGVRAGEVASEALSRLPDVAREVSEG